MIRKSYYDEELRTDKVWYDSSTVYFSKFVENENDNLGQLYVTFKNGSTYHYVDVDMPTDYILFKTGGIDMSQGKTLNSRIKSKYEYIKIDNININDLELELELLLNNNIKNNINNIYFISGHRNLSEDEFINYYIPEIDNIISNDNTSRFIIGDCDGCDIMAQNYLFDSVGYNKDYITIYTCIRENGQSFVNPNATNIIDGFPNDIERDIAMTKNSHYDVAYVRNNMELSGTAQNILRRKMFKYLSNSF